MTRGALADALQSDGISIPSEDKARYLGTILWRKSAIFENLEGKGYWLRNQKIPQTKTEKMLLAMGEPAAGVGGD